MGQARAKSSAGAPIVDPDAFGYVCRRCNRCCYDKKIQVNPYELSRVANSLGISAAEVKERFTAEGRGEHLGQNEDGSCVFLSVDGCTVHPDRPLVCRLYPLKRIVSEGGQVRFELLDGHPQSAGTVTSKGSVAAYFEAQGAEPFIAAADAYFAWFCAALKSTAADRRDLACEEGSVDLLDLDRTVEIYCTERGVPLPETADAKLSMHLQILYDELARVDDSDESVEVQSQ